MAFADLITDYYLGGRAWHLLLEVAVIIISIFSVGLLVREYLRRREELERLGQQLKTTRADLSVSRERLQQAGKHYQQVIQNQFDEWQLTPSEKAVASLLLKGLSFDEIASVRDTREKTVRQQASTIYRKSGLAGRHEFAAWFFEDFLQ
ncbi:MAG: helix-turn-helix transcriptional regulator, partial [Thiothrix sp.]|nr:helix-turn-helix transcriptional regulator [Thiothrix sp.]